MPKPLSIYIHWPFCRRICPYCDFNVRRWRNQDTAAIQQALVADLRQEIESRTAEGADWQLESIHFGGGTPSMMPPALLTAVIAAAKALLPGAPNLEIALEANPEDVAVFSAIAKAGIRRLTLGVQSIRQDRLSLLGRQHSPKQALMAIQIARELFPSIAVDMILATPHQTVADWRDELSELLNNPIDHVSLYGLTIEAGTAFGKRPPAGLPDNDLDADLMLLSREIMGKAGFNQYEVSNFAQAGHESRYNRGVWQSHDYIGIGPGAHGRHHSQKNSQNKRYAWRKLPDPKAWQDAVLDATKDSCVLRETLTDKEAIQEWLLMGFRLCAGLDLVALPKFLPAHITRQHLQSTLENSAEFATLLADKIYAFDGQFLRITNEASLSLDYWIAALYAILEPSLIEPSLMKQDT